MNITFVIFCFNERKNIESVILSTLHVANTLSSTYEIIVVDDGSTDGSEEVIKQYPQLKYIRHATNKGIGTALQTGYSSASKEFVCAIPGDGQFDVSELLQLKPFGFYTIYSFYRPETNYNYYRRLLTTGNKLFNRFFLGIKLKDVNWIKVYRKDQLNFVQPQLRSSLVESEICAKLIKSGCSAIEIPSAYLERKAGISTGGSWKTLSKAITEIIELCKEVYSFNKKPKFDK